MTRAKEAFKASILFLKHILRRLFVTEGYKVHRNDEIRRINFYSQFIKQGDLCFDAGANLGNRTSPLLKIGSKVLAIEPQSLCYYFLRLRFGNRIRIEKKGVGSFEGQMDLYLSEATTISSVSKPWIDSVKAGRFSAFNWNRSERIQITTLDRLIQKYGKPVFIKLDIEGYESEALNGLSEPVNLIAVEYTIPEQTENTIQCLERMKKLSPSAVCNYSVAETDRFSLEKWISIESLSDIIRLTPDQLHGFGDIYIRFNENY